MIEERKLLSGFLSKDTQFAVMISGPVGAAEIAVLIRKLEIDREILSRAAGIETEESKT